MTPPSNTAADEAVDSPAPKLAPEPAPEPASAGGGEWRRMAAFLLAAALSVAAALVLVREVHVFVYNGADVYVAPEDATAAQQAREAQTFRRRDLMMDLSALAFAAALLAGAFGAAAGFCRSAHSESPPKPRFGRALRGAAVGVVGGVVAGLAAAGLTCLLLRSSTLAGWGGAAGDRQLFPAMVTFALQMGLIGAVCGLAVRLAGGARPKWSAAGAARGPVVAGTAAGVVCGLLLPIAGVVTGTFTSRLIDARGFDRPIPLGRAGQALLLIGFGLLAAIALARVSGRPAQTPAASPARPAAS